MENWHKELSKDTNLKFESWIPSCIQSYSFYNKNEILEITIDEITNNVDLKLEGRDLKHCVFSYNKRCKSGGTSIFSLKRISSKGEMKRTLTIEVRNSTIVQIKGKSNSSPKKNDLKFVNEWANINNLELRGNV